MRNVGAVCSILFVFVFFLKMSHNIYHMSSRAIIYQNISPSVTRKPWRVISPSAFGIGCMTRQGFRVTEGLIFWYVTLEAMWYMYNIVRVVFFLIFLHKAAQPITINACVSNVWIFMYRTYRWCSTEIKCVKYSRLVLASLPIQTRNCNSIH